MMCPGKECNFTIMRDDMLSMAKRVSKRKLHGDLGNRATMKSASSVQDPTGTPQLCNLVLI